MKLRIFEKGFNYSQDGPGNRLVYHLQGCNMRCRWCTNPEGMPTDAPLMADENLLVDSVCPHGAIVDRALDRAVCARCSTRECIREKKNLGIVCKCREYDVDSLIEEITDSSAMFFDNGGITLTGGEPTLQYDAVCELLEKAKTRNIHTAVETNAASTELVRMLPLIDHLIMDFKHYDSGIHREYTSLGNETVKANLRAISEMQKPTVVRIPVIGGFNAEQRDIEGFIDFFSQLNNDCLSYEFLKYHEFGKDKWKKCGMAYRMDDSAYVRQEVIERFTFCFRQSGLKTITT